MSDIHALHTLIYNTTICRPRPYFLSGSTPFQITVKLQRMEVGGFHNWNHSSQRRVSLLTIRSVLVS